MSGLVVKYSSCFLTLSRWTFLSWSIWRLHKSHDDIPVLAQEGCEQINSYLPRKCCSKHSMRLDEICQISPYHILNSIFNKFAWFIWLHYISFWMGLSPFLPSISFHSAHTFDFYDGTPNFRFRLRVKGNNLATIPARSTVGWCKTRKRAKREHYQR